MVEDHRESLWKAQVANASLEPLDLESIFLSRLFKESEGSGRGERGGARSLARTLTRSRRQGRKPETHATLTVSERRQRESVG